MAKARYTHVMWAKSRKADGPYDGWAAERFSRSEAGAGKYRKLYERQFETQVLPIDTCPTGKVIESRSFHPYDQIPDRCKKR